MLPQLIFIGLNVAGLIMKLVKIESKEAAQDFLLVLISTAIAFGLLYWGGFFAPLFGG